MKKISYIFGILGTFSFPTIRFCFPYFKSLTSKRVFPLVSTGSKSSQLISLVWRSRARRAQATEAACSAAEGVWVRMPGVWGGAPGIFSGFTCPRLQEIITESRKLLIMTDRDVCITLFHVIDW